MECPSAPPRVERASGRAEDLRCAAVREAATTRGEQRPVDSAQHQQGEQPGRAFAPSHGRVRALQGAAAGHVQVVDVEGEGAFDRRTALVQQMPEGLLAQRSGQFQDGSDLKGVDPSAVNWWLRKGEGALLGSAVASIALTFAILETGGGGTRLGWVMAARILPLVLMLLVGGVVGDRLGSRQAMLMADAVRCLTQLGLVAVLLDGEPHLWTLVGLVALWGAAEALFTPALGALVPHIVRPDALSDANALLEVTRSATSIAGPVLAGLLTAVVDASTVLTLDAASYAVSMVALLLLPRDTVHHCGRLILRRTRGRLGRVQIPHLVVGHHRAHLSLQPLRLGTVPGSRPRHRRAAARWGDLVGSGNGPLRGRCGGKRPGDARPPTA